MKTLSDEKIISYIQQTKDHEKFGILYDRHSDKVYNKCLSFTKNSDEAQDLLHDIFLKVFLNLSNFKHESKFTTWLYSITYNYCVDYFRKKNKMYTEELDDNLDVPESEDAMNELRLMAIQAEQLSEVLDKIDPDSKALLLMKYQDGMSLKEIMEVLNLGESAIKMRIKRAKAKVIALHDKKVEVA